MNNRYSLQEINISGFTHYEIIDTDNKCKVVYISKDYATITKVLKELETKTAKIEIDNKIIECKIIEIYNNYTIRIEHPEYYNGLYNGIIAETVSQDKIIL